MTAECLRRLVWAKRPTDQSQGRVAGVEGEAHTKRTSQLENVRWVKGLFRTCSLSALLWQVTEYVTEAHDQRMQFSHSVLWHPHGGKTKSGKLAKIRMGENLSGLSWLNRECRAEEQRPVSREKKNFMGYSGYLFPLQWGVWIWLWNASQPTDRLYQ